MARPKGSQNRKTKELHELADSLGISPFQILLHFANGDWKALGYKKEGVIKANEHCSWLELTIPTSVRAKAAGEACEYLYPKRKAVELSAGENGFKVIIEDYMAKAAPK